MWLKLNEAISTLHDDPGIFLFNLVISLRKTARRRAWRNESLELVFCRFSVFLFLRILAKETFFGHVVFFVVTPTVLAMPVSLT